MEGEETEEEEGKKREGGQAEERGRRQVGEQRAVPYLALPVCWPSAGLVLFSCQSTLASSASISPCFGGGALASLGSGSQGVGTVQTRCAGQQVTLLSSCSLSQRSLASSSSQAALRAGPSLCVLDPHRPTTH